MLRSLFARSRPVFRPFCWTQQRCSSSGWQVSSCGRVRFPTGKVSYGHLSCSGYRYVQIDKQGHSVHRLVAAAFLGPPPDPTCWQVNHNDCEPGNNHVSNLQYATNSANQKHSYATNSGRQSSAAKLAKAVLWRPVGEESWTFCPSQREAARLLGVWPSAVRMCCSGLINKSNGNGVWYEFKVAPTVAPGRPSDEVWRPARYPGWSGVIPNLLVSNKGRVSQTKSEAFHSGTRSRSGYYVVTRVGRKLYVQRLVAATFLGQPQSPDHQVNHKDSNRGNNHIQIWSMSRRLRTCGTRMRSVWDRIRSQEPPSRCWPVSGEATDPGWSLSRSRQRLPTQGSIGPSSPASATGLTPPFLGSSGSRPRCCCRAKSGARWCCRA
ncbi:unnamed protein product [Symbiodinium natans]|uniref:HNH nuclease domain-containing protein n=1 Tax=Symbiodinium natans TaxID=878477 RepID=A0A812PJ35_9DINO|nr:unnamed protein product [Symbiodinium natans]